MMQIEGTHQQSQLSLMNQVHNCLKTSTKIFDVTLEGSFSFLWTDQTCSSPQNSWQHACNSLTSLRQTSLATTQKTSGLMRLVFDGRVRNDPLLSKCGSD